MRISIMFCHFKTGMMSAYTVSQILKYKGNHEVEILICDNNSGDGSIEYLKPFEKQIKIFDYPKGITQSHGCGYDMLVPHVSNEYFITMESDSFPIKDGYLDYYENIINQGFDCGGSLLTLSGGSYLHPAGAIFKKNLWEEAKKYCDELPYAYFPNMLLRENHSLHTMIHETILDQVLENPEDWFELSSDYKPYSKKMAISKLENYRPVRGPFHSGMGGRQESIRTFGSRNLESDPQFVIYNNKWQKIIGRIGYEPGEWFHFYNVATGKKIYYIPTVVKWLPGKEFQQQEYTLTESHIHHCWGVSAYHGYTPVGDDSVASIKQLLPEKLYSTLPQQHKI